MESIKAAEARVVAADQKSTSIKMLVCKAKGQVSEVELEFEQAKRYADVMMDNAKSSATKLK